MSYPSPDARIGLYVDRLAQEIGVGSYNSQIFILHKVQCELQELKKRVAALSQQQQKEEENPTGSAQPPTAQSSPHPVPSPQPRTIMVPVPVMPLPDGRLVPIYHPRMLRDGQVPVQGASPVPFAVPPHPAAGQSPRQMTQLQYHQYQQQAPCHPVDQKPVIQRSAPGPMSQVSSVQQHRAHPYLHHRVLAHQNGPMTPVVPRNHPQIPVHHQVSQMSHVQQQQQMTAIQGQTAPQDDDYDELLYDVFAASPSPSRAAEGQISTTPAAGPNEEDTDSILYDLFAASPPAEQVREAVPEPKISAEIDEEIMKEFFV